MPMLIHRLFQNLACMLSPLSYPKGGLTNTFPVHAQVKLGFWFLPLLGLYNLLSFAAAAGVKINDTS